MSDKIKVEFSLATLEAEAAKSAKGKEPLRVALKDNVIITFKDPADIGVFDLYDFINAGDSADITELLERLLSEEDYAALREYNPTGKVLGLLMEKVNTYFGTEAANAPKS